MRTFGLSVLLIGCVVFSASRAQADDAEARAVVDKAIKAAGGEEVLSKYKATTSKMKGTVHVMGMDIDFTAEAAGQGSNQQRVVIEFAIDGMKITFNQVLNRDKGWVKINDMLMELDGDKLAEAKRGAYEQWLGTLLPLKSKEVQLALIGESKVEDKAAISIKVTGKDRGDVTMYFDKETHLLVKTEMRVKDDMSGQEVNQETFMSGHSDKGAKLPLKLAIKRDGKPFLEAEFTDIKAEEKLDDSTFDKP